MCRLYFSQKGKINKEKYINMNTPPYFCPSSPGESIFELLKEPGKRKIPPQKSTVDHILLSQYITA